MRICLIAGLTVGDKRKVEEYLQIQLSKSSARIYGSFFSLNNMRQMFAALLKLRYKDCNVDWSDSPTVSRIIAVEMRRGFRLLMDDNNLNNFLFTTTANHTTSRSIPVLNLIIGNYGDSEMEATLNINDSNIPNTQILIAGSTGSGKTNLLAVLINQFRSLSTETAYPVNFLLFD